MYAHSNDIDIAICQHPAEIPQAEWTPDKQFQAAMTKLRTSYASRNETDTTTLRRQLQELLDDILTRNVTFLHDRQHTVQKRKNS